MWDVLILQFSVYVHMLNADLDVQIGWMEIRWIHIEVHVVGVVWCVY